MTFSGPLFEPAENGPWQSVHGKTGGHYNTFACRGDVEGMAALREFFPEGEANDLNFVLFSTSGVHGGYSTIEEEEAAHGKIDEDGVHVARVTFLIVQPRLATVRYGNCKPNTPDDFAFLKKLRASSWAVVPTIGAPEVSE